LIELALTDREREIMRLVKKGFTYYRIARKLHVNSGTVARQHKNALAKLDKAKKDLDFAAGLEKSG